jgi:hypothetical protein
MKGTSLSPPVAPAKAGAYNPRQECSRRSSAMPRYGRTPWFGPRPSPGRRRRLKAKARPYIGTQLPKNHQDTPPHSRGAIAPG